MKTIIEQLSNYKSVHLNSSNVKTHFIGIPLIIWSVILLLSTVNFNFAIFGDGDAGANNVHISLAVLIAAVISLYYFVLHIPLTLMIIICFTPLFYSAAIVVQYEFTYLIAGVAFFVGWVFQLIGHSFEKAKPAFLDDLNQLLIGPLFLIAEIYFALGLNKEMANKVQVLATNKRRILEQNKA